LDRDGTVIVEREYLADPQGVAFVPGAEEAIRRLTEAGLVVVVVTNQSGIARGLYTEEDYHSVARRLDELLARASAPVDATYYCPHHPDCTGPCDCRKPSTGMYRTAARDLGLDLAGSFYVGDRLKDVLPALELGGKGILVRTGYGREEEKALPAGAEVVDDLTAAVELIGISISGNFNKYV
jgi:D-glycero-D-manno-heptose 1,7-bisphosphate phosphatase